MNTKENLPQLRSERSEDYSTAYANNITVETSVWDMKITFGELDQAAGVIAQHTAITIPWSIVKLFVFLMRAQITAQEIQFGPIAIPPTMLPPEFPPPPPGLKDSAVFQRTFEELKVLREQFLQEALAQESKR
jgi:hypothetical protein